MKIAIIGSGNVGGASAKALRRPGHSVTFGARAPDEAHGDETTIRQAVDQAEATIIAIPFAAASEVALIAEANTLCDDRGRYLWAKAS
jgi:predicted dinucleotide-binding enzyme